MKYKLLLIIVLISLQSLHSQKTILWSIKKVDLPKTSYVLGTFHQMGNSFVDDKPLIKQFLLQADVAVFESIEDKEKTVRDFMLQRPEDFSYRTLLDQQDVNFLENYVTTWKVPLSKIKPRELIMKLEQQYVIAKCSTVKRFDTILHMDDYLIFLSKRSNVKIFGLETSANQFDAINSSPDGEISWEDVKQSIHYLVEVLQSDKDQRRKCQLAQDYMRMKLDYQFDVKCAENHPIISNRNQKWMPQIIKLLEEEKGVFIAVGLFHLYGQCGIITQLRNQGYTIEPVKLK